MSEGWLDITPVLPVVSELPVDPVSRVALAEQCWARLSDAQRTFINLLRDCNMNVSKAARAMDYSRSETHRVNHNRWMRSEAYATVVRLLRGTVAAKALDRDRLLARQDHIVEALLTPKPVIHEGIMVRDTRPGSPDGAVLEEVEAGAASRANEVLMKASGLLKDKDVEVNIGVVGPAFEIRVMKPDGEVIDARPVGVPVSLPEPQEAPEDDEWLSTH